jgi:hypothetical protein
MSPARSMCEQDHRDPHCALAQTRKLTSPQRREPARPILIFGSDHSLGEAIARACEVRGLEYVGLSSEQLDMSDLEALIMAASVPERVGGSQRRWLRSRGWRTRQSRSMRQGAELVHPGACVSDVAVCYPAPYFFISNCPGRRPNAGSQE